MWWNPRSSQNERAAARLPEGLRIYAIGDIHGRADLLESLLLQIDEDCRLHPSRRPIVVFIGDYIDRGPASREVLDLLLGYQRTRETIFLRGNHETFVHRFLSEPAVLDEWRLCGGLETLVSYGLKPSINPNARERARLAKELAMSITKQHIELLESLNLSFNCGDFLFVHAGIRPGVPIRKQREEDLLGFARSFSAANGGSRNLSCTGIRRFTRPISGQIGLILTPEPPPVSALHEIHGRGWSLLRRPVVTGALP